MNILQMSIPAGLLILFIAAVRVFTINKLPKKTFLVLWIVVLLRLILPFSIPSRFNIFSMLSHLYKPETNYTAANSDSLNSLTKISELSFLKPIIIIWIIGILLTAIFFTVVFYKSYCRIRAAIPIRDNTFLDMWLSEQNVLRRIQILSSDKIDTPITCGIIKPKIILPKVMDINNDRQLKHILTHELIHIMRFDSVWKIILVFVVCLHWFNPTVWLLFILMNRDMEITCDEKAIKLLGQTEKTAYAESLISMAELKNEISPFYSGFSKNLTEERIVSIMTLKKTSILALTVATLFVAGATTVFAATSDKEVKEKKIISVTDPTKTHEIIITSKERIGEVGNDYITITESQSEGTGSDDKVKEFTIMPSTGEGENLDDSNITVVIDGERYNVKEVK